MNTETERKFLVKDDSFRAAAVKTYSIRQGYIAHDGGNTVRIRIRDDEGFLTIKGKTTDDGLSRPEWEMQIPLQDALELFKLCKSGRIEKFRHIVPAEGGLKWEVDEFLGENEGLVMAEIELPSPDATFARPSWLGTEVTGVSSYYNSYLSKHPYKTW
ncbi:MAG: CYTH domain-containing protein [Bacteroidales bacterium]|nr:CYTH domain-containing protein [Bacteroidales bacterium]